MRGSAALPQPSSLALPTSPAPGDKEKSTLSSTLASDPSIGSTTTRASAAPVPVPPIGKPGTATTALPLAPGHRRPLAGRLIALGGMLLVLVLLVGLSALGYNAYKKGRVELRATATTDARLHATATAAAQATATASVPLFID